MSLREERERRRDEQQQRALVAMQPGVLAIVGAEFPAHGPDSTVVGEAVPEALCRLILAGEYRGDLEQARKRWILSAECARRLGLGPCSGWGGGCCIRAVMLRTGAPTA
jgi:hypothetical protein